MKRILTTVALSAVLGGSAIAAMPAAQAASSCTTSIHIPRKVAINSDNSHNVTGTLTRSCGALDASWDLAHHGSVADSWLFFSTSGLPNGAKAAAYYYPSLDPLGSYRAIPTGASDTNGNYLPQNSPRTHIKLVTRATLRGNRHGKYVWIRAYVRRFNPAAHYGTGGWTPSGGRRVWFKEYVSGWKGCGHANTGKNGLTRWVKVYAPTRRSFKAQVSQTWNMWNRWTPSIRR